MDIDLKLLSFSSPKGGVGRTMTAANVAVIYAAGCVWAGISPKRTLLVDMDIEAPGAHYYDFAGSLARALELPDRAISYRIRNEEFADLKNMHQWMREQVDFGLLYWFDEVINNKDVKKITAKYRKGFSGEIELTQEATVKIRRGLVDLLDRTQQDQVLNPSRHLIEILDEEKNAVLYILPAAEPVQTTYKEILKDFSWQRFFDYEGGVAILSALYGYLMRDRQSSKGSPGIERLLLDQNAGSSLPSEANRAFAHNRILVTGFNLQNQDGLFSLFEDDGNETSIGDIRIVLSQYRGRPLVNSSEKDPISGISFTPLINQRRFLEQDQRRTDLITRLQQVKKIESESIFLIDFLVDAIQQEHFHAKGSTSWNELVRMLVSIERKGVPKTPEVRSKWKEIRILGEFVGIRNSYPSGPIGALRDWLSEKLGNSVSVTGVATGHEEIASLILNDQIRLGTSNGDITFLKNRLSVLKEINGEYSKSLQLRDFDIAAIPVYLIPHAIDKLEELNPDYCCSGADDRVGLINRIYLEESIIGFRRYGFYPFNDHIAFWGYPFFVEFQLLAVNIDQIREHYFLEDYFKREQRRFRGFLDPADVLSAARAAKKNSVPADRLIMTLEPFHIAQWYEWQTVVSIFGGIDFKVSNSWDDLSAENTNQLTSEKTIRATRFYLELSNYAARDSRTSDWDEAIKLFYENRGVGMAFIFPDAIPREFRDRESAHSFVYTRPPCDIHPEECWLLVIPKNRREGAPELQDLQQLLVEFMAYENQKRFQGLGGITAHKRVLESVDLWRDCPYLPPMTYLVQENSTYVRSASSQSRGIAKQIIRALDNLRSFVETKLKEKADNSNSSTDYLWHKEDFLREIENAIRKEFDSVVKTMKEA